jgi:hypothetical protein
MATYAELRSLFGDGDLRNKIEVACIIAAEGIRGEDIATPNHTNRLIWAKKAFGSPGSIRDEMLMAILAQNKTLTLVQITGASDAAIQSNVDAAVDVFADGS